MSEKNETIKRHSFLVPYGTSILGFSIILLTQPNIDNINLWIARLILILSAIIGLFALLPKPWKFISNKEFVSIVSNLSYMSWFFGFILSWITATKGITEPWNTIAFLIGFFWLLVILLLITHSFADMTKNRKILRWVIPWTVPSALMVSVINVFIHGEWLSGFILLAITGASIIVALRKWQPIGTLSSLFE